MTQFIVFTCDAADGKGKCGKRFWSEPDSAQIEAHNDARAAGWTTAHFDPVVGYRGASFCPKHPRAAQTHIYEPPAALAPVTPIRRQP